MYTIHKHAYIALQTTILILEGLSFVAGKLIQFCGFIFSWHTYSNHLVKVQQCFVEKKRHEIHENLNLTKIANHMVLASHYKSFATSTP